MSDRGEKAAALQPPSILMGGLHLAAFWALAIVQPLLSLLGKEPDFFVARDNTGGQIILWVLLLTILPPLLATLLEALINLLSPFARWLLHLAICWILLSAIALQLVKQFGDGPAWPMIFVALLLGALLVWAYAKARFVRSMSDILTVAPLVILVSFLFFSESSELTKPKSDVEAKQVKAGNPAPVVMMVFDEFPVGSLMTPSGAINPKRFPNFSELQKSSDWYRNTATDASYTAIAVPSILTGKDADRDSLPTDSGHPDSIFTLLGGSWKTKAIEPITQLCPGDVCEDRAEESESMGSALSSLTTDLKTVSAHLLLPKEMGEDLPDISQTFEGFGGGQAKDSIVRGKARQWVRDRLDAGENSLDGEGDVERFVRSIGTEGQTFDFAHIEKPHYPWTHYPSGLKYSDGTEDFRSFFDQETWFAPPYLTDRSKQAHLLEIGFTDYLIGRVIDRLKQTGRWDETLFVATADHGAAWTKDLPRREASPETLGTIGMVPLFIKAPGQSQGQIIDRPSCITEIVPEMARILEIDLPWEPDGCDRETVSIDNGTGPRVELPFAEMIAQRKVHIDRMAELFGGDGANWDRAFEWGSNKALIGQSASTLASASSPAEGGPKVKPWANGARVSSFNPGVKLNPVLRQRGTIDGLGEDVPLAVSVNGQIVAVGQTFKDRGETTYSILVPQSSLNKGKNEIALYEITGTDGSASLSPLWTSSDQ